MRLFLSLFLSVVIIQTTYSQQTLSKSQVIELYNKLYLSSEISYIHWNGDSATCQCGELADDIYLKAEDRINFFRTVTGLPEAKLNPAFNTEAQHAALIVRANDILTHKPTKDMRCFSQAGYNGCSKSCLSTPDFKNFRQTAFLTSFIDDYGNSNYYVGHRRWMLYTRLKEFGYGATGGSEALLTIDGVVFDSVAAPEYIAYPWNGYVPANLIFPKWSFSIPEGRTVDFTKATVTMTDEKGVAMKIEVLPLYPGFLDHTIVWVAKQLFSDHDIEYGRNKLEENGFLNKNIRVTIKNVKVDGVVKKYQYFVVPFKVK